MPDVFNVLDNSLVPYPDALTTGEESIPRSEVQSASVPQSTQVLRLTYFTARKTETISQVKFWTGGTAAGATPTLIRAGVWRSNDAGDLLEQLAATANDTALLATINTEYTKSFSASFQKVRGTRLACGLLVVTGATAPQMTGSTIGVQNAVQGYLPLRSASIGSSADLPSTSTSQTANVNRVYMVLLP